MLLLEVSNQKVLNRMKIKIAEIAKIAKTCLKYLHISKLGSQDSVPNANSKLKMNLITEATIIHKKKRRKKSTYLNQDSSHPNNYKVIVKAMNRYYSSRLTMLMKKWIGLNINQVIQMSGILFNLK